MRENETISDALKGEVKLEVRLRTMSASGINGLNETNENALLES